MEIKKKTTVHLAKKKNKQAGDKGPICKEPFTLEVTWMPRQGDAAMQSTLTSNAPLKHNL